MSAPELNVDDSPMPEGHREEIERRMETADLYPEDSIPWEDVLRLLREKP